MLSSVLSYAIAIWLIALVVACAQGEHVSNPLIVFGIIHAAEAVALVLLIVAMLRFPYAYFPLLVLNVLFIIATAVMSALISTHSLGDESFQMLKSPLIHLLLIWEAVAAIALQVLVGMEVQPLVKALLMKRKEANPKPDPASRKRSRETIKLAPGHATHNPATPNSPKPVKTLEEVQSPEHLIEVNSDEIPGHGVPERQRQQSQGAPALNELRRGSSFEKELARALLM